MNVSTKAVHIGREYEEDSGAVVPDISLSTTFIRELDGSYRKGFQYIRSNNPTRERLEKSIATLEGQKQAVTFASGLSALSSVLLTLSSGDEVIVSDDMYYGGRAVLGNMSKQFGLKVTFCDQQQIQEIKQHITDKTKFIFVETPSNPYLKIVDIKEICELAKPQNISICVDNTWATPVLQNPIQLGADISLHSTTKYIGGHSDVQGGVLIVSDKNETLLTKLRSIQKNFGAVPSPFDCWLLLRSIPTLPLRIKEQSLNAKRIAEFLNSHKDVEQVLYPGLDGHVNHQIAQKQMINGFGGMISFITKHDEQFARKVTNKVKIFKQATSLGGIESLIEHRASVEGPDSKTSKQLIRLSIGIEDCSDLIEDLQQAIE